MSAEIREHEVYTMAESQQLLKISASTMKRLLKRGLIQANKVGGQYRVLGKELLRLVSPRLERDAAESYLRLKKTVVGEINRW